ncbi:MAG: PAS domain S-box protein, partial [Actinobacteria bacterium]|nr:PAS domain S-box protein [Actinomycetota bacterium]
MEAAPQGKRYDNVERARVEKALRGALRFRNAIIRASPLALIALDAEGKVTMWSPAAERIFGWSKKEMLGRPFSAAFEVRPGESTAILERREPFEAMTGIELQRRRKDGSVIDISLSTAPLYGTRGDFTGTMVVAEDITERRRAEEALNASKKQVESILESISDAF